MSIIFNKNSWDDYLYWQSKDKKQFKNLNELTKEIRCTPYEGRGNPEPLKFDMSGLWSRRIDKKHRLVYQIIDSDILIYACKFHYDK